MVDNISDLMHRELNLTNNDATNANNNASSGRLLHSKVLLSRNMSDHSSSNNTKHSQHQHAFQQPPPIPTIIATSDYANSSSLQASIRRRYPNHQSMPSGYDTDGGTTKSKSTQKHFHRTNNGYEHLVSPRLTSKRLVLTPQSQQLLTVPGQQNLAQENYLTIKPSSGMIQYYENEDEEPNSANDASRRHVRPNRRNIESSPTTERHHVNNNLSPIMSRHERVLARTTSGKPLKLIFMRHSERANQALGSDWFIKAFRTNTYRAYDQNLPMVLPKRRFDQAYEFDTPLTVRGLKAARQTGRAMSNKNLIVDVCLSSSALRCIQTCERVLAGMNRRDQIPIRIEPGLFECPHFNQNIIDSFMSKRELVENGYNIKVEYKPLIQKLYTPESLDEYFSRCATVMRGIIDRYGNHGGTVLIVTHAPGLLALTDAMRGIKTNAENFYRVVATYPPLAAYIAEYDGIVWKHSDQPFLLA